MKRFFFVLATIAIAVLRPKDFVTATATTQAVNTNITAGVLATAVNDHEVMLNMWATSADGTPIAGFNVYRDGVWIATITNNLTTFTKPNPPNTLKIQ